ncbi:MAG: hypothetical protein ACREP7_20600 [Lysobacter sp.]
MIAAAVRLRAAGIALSLLALSACGRTPPDPAKAEASTAHPTAAIRTDNANAEASVDRPTAESTDTSPDHPALAPVADYVLPGALAPDLGPEQLRQLFGAANVSIDDHLPGSEGDEYRGVVLYPKDSTRRAYVYFQDAQKLRGLSTVSILDRDTRWRLDTGIAMAMPLAELARLNGKPIRFGGLGWDYGGNVNDWNGGKLANKDGDPVMRHVRLDYIGEGANGSDDYPVGDSDFSSDDKRYPKQGRLLNVVELGVSFPGQDDL